MIAKPDDPIARLAGLPEFPPGPEARQWERERRAPYLRCAPPGGAPPSSAPQPVPQVRDVWLPYKVDPAQPEDGQWAPHCPCFNHFRGSALRHKEFDVPLSSGLRLLGLHSEFRNDTHVIGLLEDQAQRVRWLALHQGDLRFLGADGDKIWLTVGDLSMDVHPARLVALDTKSLKAQTCLVLGGTAGRAEPDAHGIRYDGEGEAGNISRLFTWQELEQERRAATGRAGGGGRVRRGSGRLTAGSR